MYAKTLTQTYRSEEKMGFSYRSKRFVYGAKGFPYGAKGFPYGALTYF